MAARWHRLPIVCATIGLVAGLCGCAAAIIGNGTPEDRIIHPGSTRVELARALGQPLRQVTLSPPRRAWDLREADAKVSLLIRPEYGFDVVRGSYPIPPADMAITESAYRFKGRVGTDSRAAGQAGFDSFMTLGLAEVFLIPSALRDRAGDPEYQLIVWFDLQGRALAYRWDLAAAGGR